MSPFGHSRTIVSLRHALIAPDGHVPSTFPGWSNATAFVMLSPAMGADLTQMLVTFGPGGGTATFPSDIYEHAIYVETGDCSVEVPDLTIPLKTTGFIFIPSDTPFTLRGNESTRVTIFRKVFEMDPDLDAPPMIHGLATNIPGEPFLGGASRSGSISKTLRKIVTRVASFPLRVNGVSLGMKMKPVVLRGIVRSGSSTLDSPVST